VKFKGGCVCAPCISEKIEERHLHTQRRNRSGQKTPESRRRPLSRKL
jgi:hypothetical protein